MKKCTRIAALLITVCVLLLAAGCGTSESATAEEDVLHVANLSRSTRFESMKEFEDVIVEVVGADPSMDIVAYNCNEDSLTQIQQIEDCITMGIDVIVISANTGESIQEALYECNEKGIEVLSVFSPPDEGPEFTYVGYSNYQCGYAQGQYLAENLPENGNILLMVGASSTENSAQRRNGFVDGIAASGRTDYTILEELESDYSTATAMNIMEDWLQKYDDGDFDAVITPNDLSAMGVLNALTAANVEHKVLICGIDGDSDAVQAIVNGEIAMTVKQTNDVLADKVYECIKMYQNGEKLEALYETPLVTITAENAGEFLK